MLDINNLNQQHLDYLSYLKKNWVDQQTAFSKLEENINTGKFGDTPQQPQQPEQTLWSKAKEFVWDRLASPFKMVWWAIKWAYEWIKNAPDVFWQEWWAARMEQAWIKRQKEANIKEAEKLPLINQTFWTELSPEWFISPQELAWATEELTAPVVWPIRWVFWKAMWWLLWAIQWAMTPEEKKAFKETWAWITAAFKEVDKAVESKLWKKRWEAIKSDIWDVVQPAAVVWEIWADVLWAWSIAKWIKLPKWDRKPNITWDEKLIWKLWEEKVKWYIDWKEVEVPKPSEGVIAKATTPFRESNPKVLAWKALTPSFAGKSPKQIINTTKNIEKTTKNFYDNVRTWKLKWWIQTLEEAAETTVKNLDIVWAKIWEAVKDVKWTIKPSDDFMKLSENVLKSNIEKRSPVYKTLTEFIQDTWEWLSIQDAFKAKKIYWDKIQEFISAKQTSSDSYKALVKWVTNINNKIDEVIESQLKDPKHKENKALYNSLKTMVNDIVKSAAVEWRRSPNTFVEQMWMLDSMLSPIQWVRNIFAKEIWELNTRWWAWKELIKLYDKQAIKWKPSKTLTKAEITPKTKKTLQKWWEEAYTKSLNKADKLTKSYKDWDTLSKADVEKILEWSDDKWSVELFKKQLANTDFKVKEIKSDDVKLAMWKTWEWYANPEKLWFYMAQDYDKIPPVLLKMDKSWKPIKKNWKFIIWDWTHRATSQMLKRWMIKILEPITRID